MKEATNVKRSEIFKEKQIWNSYHMDPWQGQAPLAPRAPRPRSCWWPGPSAGTCGSPPVQPWKWFDRQPSPQPPSSRQPGSAWWCPGTRWCSTEWGCLHHPSIIISLKVCRQRQVFQGDQIIQQMYLVYLIPLRTITHKKSFLFVMCLLSLVFIGLS